MDHPVRLCHHGHGRVIVRLGQVKADPNTAAPPEGQILSDPAALDLLHVHIALDAETLVHDVAVLTKEILPLVFVENGHGPEILDRLKDLFVVHRNRVCLVDDQVIGLPLFPERVIWLIEQRKDVLFVQHLIQNFFCDVDLIDHHVIVVGVLRGNDNAQLVDEGDLRRSHGLHRIAVQRAGLVSQEDICQTAVHAVVGICEGCIFNLVDQAGDQIPVDLEILRQCRRDLDDLAHGQPQLRGQLEVRRHREETGEAGLRQHPQNEDDCGVEGLEVLSGDLENSGLIEAPVVLTPPRTEYGHDQEPGVIFKAVIHGAVEIRVHHQLQKFAYLPIGLFTDVGFLMLPVRDLQPLIRLELYILTDLPIAALRTPLGVPVSAAVFNHHRSGPPAGGPFSPSVSARQDCQFWRGPAERGKAHCIPATDRSGTWPGHSADWCA